MFEISEALYTKKPKMFSSGRRSMSSIIAEELRRLPAGSAKCFERRPETDDPKDLERQRALWITAARRAGFSVLTRITTNSVGDPILRVWRKS